MRTRKRTDFRVSVFTALLAVLPLLATGCGQAENPWAKVEGGPPYVLTSFPPLYCFAKNVAGPDAGVLCLMTPTGPPNYPTTPFDPAKVRRANLFLVNGLGLDEFVTKLAGDSGQVEIYKVGDQIPHQQLIHADAEESEQMHKDKDGKACKHEHGEHDPHVWLGLPQAISMVEKIRDKLQAVDPAHKEGYAQRAEAYLAELKKLHEYGKEKFKDKKNRALVTTHDSLRYFADAFELEIEGSIQQAGQEADAVKLARLAQLCKDKKVSVIVVEPQYRKGPAVTLQKNLATQGVMVEVAEVDPLETAPADPQPDPAYYVQQMRRNIDNLAKALR